MKVVAKPSHNRKIRVAGTRDASHCNKKGRQPARGTFTIGGFGGELWILGYADNIAGPDLMLNLWSAMGEGALTADNIIK